MAWRLVDKQYISQPVNDGVFYSEALGLELVDTGKTLRLRDPKSGQFLPTEEEEIAARLKAEAEVERLRKELDRLKKQATKKRRTRGKK